MTRVIHICIGRQGSGKTTRLAELTRQRIVELADAGVASPVVIHDTRCGAPGRWMEGVGLLAPESCRFATVDDLLEAVRDDGTFPGLVMTVYRDEAEEVCKLAQARAETGRATMLVVDELDRLPDLSHSTSRHKHAAVYAVQQYGRPYPIDVFASTRQPQRVDSGWLAQATHLSLFALDGDLQLQRIRSSGWPHAEYLCKRVSELDKYEYLPVALAGG